MRKKGILFAAIALNIIFYVVAFILFALKGVVLFEKVVNKRQIEGSAEVIGLISIPYYVLVLPLLVLHVVSGALLIKQYKALGLMLILGGLFLPIVAFIAAIISLKKLNNEESQTQATPQNEAVAQ